MLILEGKRLSVTAAAQEGRRRTLEQVILDTCRRWATLFPAQLVAFGNQIKMRRDLLHKKTGMSRNGTMLSQGMVPVRLYHMMARALRRKGSSYNPHWINDDTVRRIFWQVFKVGRINASHQKDHRCRTVD